MPRFETSDWRIAPAASPAPFVAIGDIHGCADLLSTLRQGLLCSTAATRIYLGDLIDPKDKGDIAHDCAAVVDQVALDLADRATVLAGNHDAFLKIALHCATKGAKIPWSPGRWADQGGRATAAAWGIRNTELAEIDLAMRVWHAMTPAQRQVFESMRIWDDRGPYLLVHAGFEPHVPLDKQQARANVLSYPSQLRGDQESPLWMRFNHSTDAAPKGRILVHGHSPTRKPFLGRKRFSIDTGAKHGGPLTAVEFGGGRFRLHQAWPDGLARDRWEKDGLR